MIGIPAAATQRCAEKLVMARDPVACRRQGVKETRTQGASLICNLIVSWSYCLYVLLKDSANLLTQLRRHALIGIQEQHPITHAYVERAVALGREATPRLDDHLRAVLVA